MPAIEEIAKYLVKTKFEDIPSKTVERQKDLVIDTLGVAVAGSRAPGVEKVVKLLSRTGGKQESRILVYGTKLPSVHTTMVNSLMAHALDFDDMHEEAGIHTNICVVPAALAMAERVGGVDGKTFLTAVILGVDLICRMGVSIPLSRGWHATTTFGIFGATVASAKILGLDETKMANALGIAYCQASGNRQGRLEGALTKRLQPALAAKAGVFSSLLSYEGVTGPKGLLEGDWGMLNLYTDPRYLDNQGEILKCMMQDLSKRFLGDELSIKPYPSCRATHSSIDGVLSLMERNKIQVSEIEEVEIFVSNGCYQTVGHPFKIRTDPQVDAQFSIPYTVATAILTGNVELENFTEAAIKDARRMAMAKRVKVSIDKKFQDPSTNVVNLESRVAIKVKGETFSHWSPISKGHPKRPMDRSEILSKFKNCLRFGAHLYPDEGDQVLSAILKLEELHDVSCIPSLLC